MAELLPRLAARAVIIDDFGRTLLFRIHAPAEPSRLSWITPGGGLEGEPSRVFWITPGGGLEPGETELDTLRRELFEETGLTACDIGPCVWLRDQSFTWGERRLRQRETYYLVRCRPFAVDTSRIQAEERDFLQRFRWFSLDELLAWPERLVPADFAHLFAPLVRGELPTEPVVIGR